MKLANRSLKVGEAMTGRHRLKFHCRSSFLAGGRPKFANLSWKIEALRLRCRVSSFHLRVLCWVCLQSLRAAAACAPAAALTRADRARANLDLENLSSILGRQSLVSIDFSGILNRKLPRRPCRRRPIRALLLPCCSPRKRPGPYLVLFAKYSPNPYRGPAPEA